jgi:hypothetical protein
MLTLAPLIALMFLIGIAPNPLIDMFDQSARENVLAPAQRLPAMQRMQPAQFGDIPSQLIPPGAPADPHNHNTAPGAPTGAPRP